MQIRSSVQQQGRHVDAAIGSRRVQGRAAGPRHSCEDLCAAVQQQSGHVNMPLSSCLVEGRPASLEIWVLASDETIRQNPNPTDVTVSMLSEMCPRSTSCLA